MKCIRLQGASRFAITRVSDEMAQQVVGKTTSKGAFVYVPKREWKKAGRP